MAFKSWFRALLLTLVVCAMVGCGDETGACAGTDGQFHECQQDFTASECEDLNTKGLNGFDWAHHPGKSCPDIGYTLECTPGSFGKYCN